MTRPTIWMTGGTGFVGSHFLLHVLEHSDAEVVAIVRASGADEARARLLEVLEQAAWSQRRLLDTRSFARRLQVMTGDITAPDCGVQLGRAQRSPGSVFWHIAASLQFEDKFSRSIREHNVIGTEHALSLAARLDAGRFVYVSTAYSCGQQTGLIPETLHSLDRAFNNAYERSKCEAERLVASWSARTGRAVTIVRPSIVVGPVKTHLPGGSDTGLYGFAREVCRIRRVLQAAGQSLAMLGDAAAPVNLIPVDVLVEEMVKLSAAGFAGGLVHHLTSDRHPSVARLLEVVGRECGAGPIGVVAERTRPASPVERIMDRRAGFYSSYLRGAKTFARRSGRPIAVSDEDLLHFVHSYVRLRRNEAVDTSFERRIVTGSDGTPLVSYAVGRSDGPVLVCCNAYGVASDVWVPLAKALGNEHRLISWELRPEPGVDQHVADLLAIMQQHGVERAHVLGFCTGADLALRFAELYPRRVAGLVSLSGALNGARAGETDFQRHMRNLAGSAGRDLAHARLYHELLFGQRRGEVRDEAMLVSMVGELDPGLLHLTSQPFRDAASLLVYARQMQAHYEHCGRSPLLALALPALLVAARHDPIAHPEASRVAFGAWPNATLHELSGTEHFALYNDPEVWEVVRRFVRPQLSAADGAAAAA